MITGIGHMAIRCADVETSAAFYTQKLGMREGFRMHNEKNEVIMVYIIMAPDVFLELFPNGVQPPEVPKDAAGFVHICLQVDDAEAQLEFLRKNGAPIDREIAFGKSGCKQFFTHDPDGNRIELMQIMPESKQAQATRAFV